jgi:hypothetical protein
MAGWTLLQLRNEFLGRGFDYFTTARANTYLNYAYQELCGMELWPFLESTASGAAPLTIADVRTVWTVRDTVSQQALTFQDIRDLTQAYSDLTTTGTPYCYYLEGGAIKTFPVGGTLSVRYFQIPATLSGDTDVAVVPDRYCMLIVDIAVRRALLDDNDAGDYSNVAQEIQAGVQNMRNDLLWQDVFDGQTVSIVAGSGDTDFGGGW